jgi:hypothetical protein
MEDPVRTAAIIGAVILLAVVLPAAAYTYWARKKAAWRKNINVGWRKHASEAELMRPACGETRNTRRSR